MPAKASRSPVSAHRPHTGHDHAPPAEPPIDELWRRYRATRCVDLRNQLMLHHLPLVRYRAERLAARLPSEVDFEDLMSAGVFGLRDALAAFDPEHGVKFSTFASRRIHGSMIDELRHMDWVPRTVRDRTAMVKRASARFELEFGRKPTHEELVGALDVPEKLAGKILKDGFAAAVSSFDRPRYQREDGRATREIDVIADAGQPEPASEVQRRALRRLITRGLSRAEQLIVVLYYFENLTMREIGATLDLSESRVSQMHSLILARLKTHLLTREPEFEPIKP